LKCISKKKKEKREKKKEKKERKRKKKKSIKVTMLHTWIILNKRLAIRTTSIRRENSTSPITTESVINNNVVVVEIPTVAC
jgi:hypothetical protein